MDSTILMKLFNYHAYPVDTGSRSSGFRWIYSPPYTVLHPGQPLTLLAKASAHRQTDRRERLFEREYGLIRV